MATTLGRGGPYLACLSGGNTVYFACMGATGTPLRPGWPPAAAYAGAALFALFTVDAAYRAHRPVDPNSRRERVIYAVGGAFEVFLYGLGALIAVVMGLDWVVLRLLGRAG